MVKTLKQSQFVLLFLLLKYTDKRVSRIMLIIFPILYYGFSIIFKDGRAEIWDTFYGVYLPMVRGLADLSIGILLCRIHAMVRESKIYNNKMIIRAVEVVSFLGIVALVILPMNLDAVTVVVMCFFIIAIMNEESLLEKIGKQKIVQNCSKLEYPIFLNHAVIITLFRQYVIGKVQWRVGAILLLLFVIVFIYSMITNALVFRIQKMIKWERFSSVGYKSDTGRIG